MTWWRRVLNGLRPDHNPLRRPVDRLESMLTLGLIVVFLVATPLLAFGVGHWAWQDAAATARTEQAAWHKVSAVVLQGVPAPKNDPYGAIYLAQIPVRWTAENGRRTPARSRPRPGSAPGLTSPSGPAPTAS